MSGAVGLRRDHRDAMGQTHSALASPTLLTGSPLPESRQDVLLVRDQDSRLGQPRLPGKCGGGTKPGDQKVGQGEGF